MDQETRVNESPTPTQQNDTHFILRINKNVGILVAVVLLAFIVSFALYMYTKATRNPKLLVHTLPEAVIQDENLQDTEQNVSSPTQSSVAADDNNRAIPSKVINIDQFDTFNIPLPSVITELTDEDLVEINCTPPYTSGLTNQPFYTTDKDDTIIHMTDTRLLSYVDNHPTRRIQLCSTQNQGDIILQETSNGGGGGGANFLVNIGYVNEQDKFINPTSILNEGEHKAAYFGCYNPIALTSSNNFFVLCGGQGPITLFNVDLNLATYSIEQLWTWNGNEKVWDTSR